MRVFSKAGQEAGLLGKCVCLCMSAGMQRANVVVFLLVSDTQSLVGGVRECAHPSMDLVSLVHITATSFAVQSSIFSSLCLRQVLGRSV